MGAQTFSKELSALTGSQKSVGPPPGFRVGSKVEMNINGKWYPCTISSIQAGVRDPRGNVAVPKTYTILHPNGEEDCDVTENRLRPVKNDKRVGGVLFLDEAYDLDPEKNPEGRAILAELMSVAEDQRDSVTIILSGYKDDIEQKLFRYNVGMASRFQVVPFEDFSREELGSIWRGFCKDKEWRCEEDVCDVVSRRLARGIGRRGFGNARDVRNLFQRTVSIAKMRFFRDERKDAIPTIVMEDVIGKEPLRNANAELDRALRELEGYVGLNTVKKAIMQLVDVSHNNYIHEKKGERVDDVMLNRLFLGNPGGCHAVVGIFHNSSFYVNRFICFLLFFFGGLWHTHWQERERPQSRRFTDEF
jgi:hypothetical protein